MFYSLKAISLILLISATRRSEGIPQEQTAISFKEEVDPIRFRMQVPPPCHSQDQARPGYCLEDPEYNENIVSRFASILENHPISNLVSDVLDETLVLGDSPMVRFGGSAFISEQTPCISRETIIYPKRGQTPNSDWVFILNQGDFQQGVKVEKCSQENSECQFGAGGLPQTMCRQKYIYKKLLTMGNAGKDIVSESVLLPSCCVCYVSSEFVLSRSGLRPCLPLK